MFIDEYRDRFGPLPFCRVLTLSMAARLPQAPTMRPANVDRRPRARRDLLVMIEIKRVHQASHGGLYGARKIYHQLLRENILVEGQPVARCTIERLKGNAGLPGVSRRRKVRTTIADPVATRASRCGGT